MTLAGLLHNYKFIHLRAGVLRLSLYRVIDFIYTYKLSVQNLNFIYIFFLLTTLNQIFVLVVEWLEENVSLDNPLLNHTTKVIILPLWATPLLLDGGAGAGGDHMNKFIAVCGVSILYSSQGTKQCVQKYVGKKFYRVLFGKHYFGVRKSNCFFVY